MYRLIIALLFLINCNPLLLGEAKADPRAVFPELFHDFRKIKEGEKATYHFRVINGGDEPLEIERVKPDCGCTATFLSKKILPPQEEGEIKVVFDSSRRPGDFEKRIMVFTNDTEKPKTTLTIRGTVETGPSPSIEVTNRKIDFGVIGLKSPHAFALSVRNTGSENLIVHSIKNPRGEEFLNSDVVIPPQARKIVHLTYHPQKKGVINESMTLYSNDTSRPRFYVFLTGYVEQEERITILRKNQQSFLVLNNTSERIFVLPQDSTGVRQEIDPYKEVEIDFSPTEASKELTISLEFKKKE